jgi:GGDEF domain-containing protein
MIRRHWQWSTATMIGGVVAAVGLAVVALADDNTTMAGIGACVAALGLLAVVVTQFDNVTGRAGKTPILSESTGQETNGHKRVNGSGGLPSALAEMTASFNARFAQLNDDEDLWPAFDRWMRDALNQFVSARRVRCFSVNETAHRLASLSGNLDDPFWHDRPPHGLVDRVIETRQRFIRGLAGNDDITEQLAASWEDEHDHPNAVTAPPSLPDWIVPVRHERKTIGLLVVGELPAETIGDPALLGAVGHLIETFWRYVYQADALTRAQRTDRASGALNRIDLTAQAERVLREAADEDEPTVVLAMSVEGVRRLDDGGEWDLRNWLIQQIGLAMRRKLRSDDLVGRFSDDRFVAVLRRLDGNLGRLIAGKLLTAVTAKISVQPIVHRTISLRCGLAESHGQGIEDTLVRAFDALRLAREQNYEILVEESVTSGGELAEARE